MPFLDQLGQLGMQAAGGAINTGLGLLLEKHNDDRQYKQQGRLGQQQLGLNMQQMKYGKDLDYDFWKKTNYAAQVAEMKEGGLSPGLMYGMSGAGGAMIGGSAGGVNQPGAPAGGGEIMGLQILGAQKRLMEAQTEKTKAEAENIAGPERGIGEAEQKIREIAADMANESYWDTVRRIQAESQEAISNARMADTEAQLQHETFETKVGTVEAELIGVKLANELKREQKGLTQAQAEATVQGVVQAWKDLELKEGKLNLDKFVHDVSDSTKLAVETVEGIIRSVMTRKAVKQR